MPVCPLLMGFSCGIVGLPNVGKSTLFNALTRSSVPAANYPFCTIDRNVGAVPVPDPRLATLMELVPKERAVPTMMDFVDIAGLVKGASQGQGLGNQFLSHIAEVDAIAHVVRCFEDDQVAHVSGSVEPRRDIEIVETELALKDLGAVTAALGRLDKAAKGGEQKAVAAVAALRALVKPLNDGVPVRRLLLQLSLEALEALRPLNLLMAKPVLYVANVGEADAADGVSPHLAVVRELAAAQGAGVVVICGVLEAEIAALDTEAERAEYLGATGLREPGLNRLIRAGYELLGLLTFFTLGERENRAWTARRGTTAPQAAGKIHTDFERGFIRAEVVGFEEFVACGSEASARERGTLRLEGKDYVVRDGDIIHFRFNV